MHCAYPADYRILSLTRIQFHPIKVTQLINLAEVSVLGLCYCIALTPEDGTTDYKVESLA